MNDRTNDHEFRVNLKGVALTEQDAARINRAIHKTVLAELASTDLRVGLSVDFLEGRPGGIAILAKEGIK
jgi:hypothetical protein